MANRFWVAAILGLAAGPLFAAGRLSLLDDGSHCVAYKAKKRLLLVTTVTVVGKSCDVAVQVTPDLGGRYHIELSFPVRSLKSGELERDADVASLLKADQEPEMIFVSDSMTLEEWRSQAGKGPFSVHGDLKIAGRSHRLQATVTVQRGVNGVEVDGIAKTSFKNLNLKPPRLAFGLGATVKNDLELHFHFLGRRTLGADSIFETQDGE